MRFRKERLAEAIKAVVSEAIMRRINDPRLAPLTTVSRVAVSGDLALATVYLTVVGGEAVERRSLTAMRHAAGFVQRLVAEQIDMRTCPELRFELDEVAKKVRTTMMLLDENRLREPHLYQAEDNNPAGGEPVEQGPSSDSEEDAT